MNNIGRPSKGFSKDVHYKIEVSILNRLDDFCFRSRMSKTSVVENALVYYIDACDKNGNMPLQFGEQSYGKYKTRFGISEENSD